MNTNLFLQGVTPSQKTKTPLPNANAKWKKKEKAEAKRLRRSKRKQDDGSNTPNQMPGIENDPWADVLETDDE